MSIASMARSRHSFALVAAACVPAIAGAAAPQEITIPGQGIFPESLTSSRNGAVYIGSSAGFRGIFRVAPGAATAESWIEPESDTSPGFLGVFADDKSRTLWACQLSLSAGQGQPPTAPSRLRAFDLDTGASKGSYPFPGGGVCNDVAVGPDGTAYATDTPGMQVLRLKKGGTALEPWAGNGGFGPAGGILDGIAVLGKRVLVNALVTSKLFSVPVERDGSAGKITEVALDAAIERPDGMRSLGRDALLVAEGGGTGRVSKVTLKGDKGTRKVLKEGFPDGPVAVTAVGKTVYVLEGQLAARRAPPGTPMKPFHATAVPLP